MNGFPTSTLEHLTSRGTDDISRGSQHPSFLNQNQYSAKAALGNERTTLKESPPAMGTGDSRERDDTDDNDDDRGSVHRDGASPSDPAGRSLPPWPSRPVPVRTTTSASSKSPSRLRAHRGEGGIAKRRGVRARGCPPRRTAPYARGVRAARSGARPLTAKKLAIAFRATCAGKARRRRK